MRMHIGARGAPALAVVLRHLVGAEPFVILGVEILANAELRFLRRLPEDLVHGVAGAQLVDAERSALAVIFAVEIGVVLRALEIGQHVRIRPAGVAQRGPVVVVPAMPADIDHGVDGGGAAEPLAARLIADAAVQSLLRHGLERPVVDLAGDHQDQRERRGDNPIVILAAGIEQRHRRARILRQASRHRAAAASRAHHHEIECIRHGKSPILSLRHCGERSDEAIHSSANAVRWIASLRSQ